MAKDLSSSVTSRASSTLTGQGSMFMGQVSENSWPIQFKDVSSTVMGRASSSLNDVVPLRVIFLLSFR